jgi:O-antigen/teichoic acid export membrane protein/O-antigen ligase
VASQLVLVVSGVLAARILGPQDRGYLALLVLVPLVLAQLGHMGVPLAVTYYLVQFGDHTRRIIRDLARLTILQIICALLIQAVVFVVLLRHESRSVHLAAFLSFAYTPTLFVQQFALSILQGQRRFRAFNILRVLPGALYSLTVVILFLLGGGDLFTIFTLFVATSFLTSILTSIFAARSTLSFTSVDSERPRVSEMFRFGLKGFFGSVSPIDNLRVDQAVIALLLNPVALGLYVVAQSFTNLPRFIAQSIGMVAYPHVAAAPSRRAARSAMWRYVAFSVVISGAVIALLELGSDWLIRFFFGPAFSGGVTVTRILLLGVFFLSTRRVLTDGARGAGSPGAGSLAEAASWASLALGLVILVPHLGIEGVAIALAASWAFSLLVLLVLVADLDFSYLRERVSSVALIVVAVAASGGAALAATLLPLALSAGLAVAFLAALFFAHVRFRLAQAPRRMQTDDVFLLHRTPSGFERSPSIDDRLPDLRLARVFYYGGLALIGVLTLRPIGSFTLSDWFFFFSLASACASIAVTRARVYIRLPSLLMGGALIFVIGSSLSTFDTDSIVGSNAVLVRTIYTTVIWFWLGTMVLEKFEHIRTAIILWVLSAAVCGSGALIQLTAGDVIPGATIHWDRVTGFAQNVNDLGGVTSIALVPALMLLLSMAKKPSRILGAGLLLVLVSAGLLLSGSVGSILAAIVAMVVWFGSHRTRPARFLALGAMVLAAFIVYTTQISNKTPSAIERIAHLRTGSPDDPIRTLDERLTTYRVATKRIQENPIIGIGLDRNTTAPAEWVHNIFLGSWYTTGFFGLIGIILIFVASARASWSSMLSARSPDERALALALACSLTAFLTYLMSEPALFIRYGWISVALVYALRGIQTRPSEAPARLSREATIELVAEPASS